jgi:uncharacterized protein (TIGR02757 family)
MHKKELIRFLEKKVEVYNQPFFIEKDPISIPHSFSKKQDIEIAGFFAAIFAWGNRTTIINKSRELMQLMDNAPHDFCVNHTSTDLKKFLAFKHRTFNTTDVLYFISFLQYHYTSSISLEAAFTQGFSKTSANIELALNNFYDYFFSLPDFPQRTTKHIASPNKKATCKRLCMYLRWMVRKDKKGVDFGIWKNILPSQLIVPLDVHVARVARHFNIIQRPSNDWQTAIELTDFCKTIDAKDPAKLDFALLINNLILRCKKMNF